MPHIALPIDQRPGTVLYLKAMLVSWAKGCQSLNTKTKSGTFTQISLSNNSSIWQQEP